MLDVRHSPDLETLGDLCASILRDAPADPFTSEWIAVPTGTVRSWLRRHLAGRLGASDPTRLDGVAMNLRFVRGDGLRQELLGHSLHGPADPWSPDSLLWRLMTLGADPATVVRPSDLPLATWASRHAARFAKYQIHRPDRLREWLARPVSTEPIAGDDAPGLYGKLRTVIGTPDPAERIAAIIDEMSRADGAPPVPLPPRLLFVGFTLPPDQATFPRLMGLVSGHCDIHYLALDPTPPADPDSWPPLVRSWGRILTRVHTGDVLGVPTLRVAPRVEPAGNDPTGNRSDPTDTAPRSVTLFSRLRHLVISGEDHSGGTSRRAGESDSAAQVPDRSVVIHGCQGLTRQVEVLRDDLLGRLAADPTLREEDVVILCADLDRAAPVIRSVLADPSGLQSAPDAPPGLRYHIDGLAMSRSDPVAAGFAALLDLVTGRVSSVDLLGFCALDAVATRWGFTDDDLATFRRWVSELGIRWGLDSAQRSRFGVPESLTLGTWRRALDRLAMGVAFASQDLIVNRAAPGSTPDTSSPFGIEGDDIERLGKLDDLMARIESIARDAGIQVPIIERLERLGQLVEDLFEDPDGRDERFQRVRGLCRVPDGAVDDSATSTLADLVPALTQALEASTTSADVTRGGITVATPRTLSGIPRKVTYLLDLDDTWIPSGVTESGDLLAADPRPGDPDPRAEARLALLTAISATNQALVVLHDERDIQTNAPIPAGIVLSEFLEAIDSLLPGSPASADTHGFVVHHPREATDPRNFLPDGIDGPSPFSFDQVALRAATARIAGRTESFEAGATPVARVADRAEVVRLDDLLRVVRDPAKYVCSDVLDVRLPFDEGDLEAHLPVNLDALASFRLKNDLFEALLEGKDVINAESLLRAKDLLPVGAFGTMAFAQATRAATDLTDIVDPIQAERTRETVQVDVPFGDERRIRGAVTVWTGEADSIAVDAKPSKPKDRDRLAGLVTAAVLAANEPDRTWIGEVVRIDGSASEPKVDSKTFSMSAHDPDGELGQFIESVIHLTTTLFDVSRLGPMPLALPMFRAKDGQLRGGKSPREAWTTLLTREKPWRFLHGNQPFEAFMAMPAHPDDPTTAGPESTPPEVSRVRLLGEQIMGLLVTYEALKKKGAS